MMWNPKLGENVTSILPAWRFTIVNYESLWSGMEKTLSDVVHVEKRWYVLLPSIMLDTLKDIKVYKKLRI